MLFLKTFIFLVTYICGLDHKIKYISYYKQQPKEFSKHCYKVINIGNQQENLGIL